MIKARPIPSTALPRDQSCQKSHRTNLAHACESADLAFFTLDSDVQQLYANAASVLYASTRVAVTAGSGLVDLHLHCVVDGSLESKVATTMLMLGLVRKSTLLDDAARCTCTSRTPRPALTAPRHDVTAALSGLAAQKHEQGFGATFDATRLHARRRDGAHRGRRFVRLSLHYRYTPRCV